MPRPRCCRRISGRPAAPSFAPENPGQAPAGEVRMSLDEFEALRLADREGLYQAQAAEQMGVSRATLGRILEAAHRKVAEALVEGRRLVIEDGAAYILREEDVACPRCAGHHHGRTECPHCQKRKKQQTTRPQRSRRKS